MDAAALLAENESLRRSAAEHDNLLRQSIESELSRIDARLMSMPYGQVAGDSAAAFEYRRLVEDRARLLLAASQLH